jgi:hypothetical protein
LISVVLRFFALLPKRQPHWVGRRRPPRLLYLACYAFILYTIAATVILIATRDMTTAVLLFSVFVVPLFFVIIRPRKQAG